MKTRHLYTLQDGEVIVLEYIVTIGTPDETEPKFFYVNMVGDTCLAVKDVEFENYKTTERAELIKALEAI